MALDRILDNIYHIEEDEGVPPLYKRLTETLAIIGAGGLTVQEVSDEYSITHPLFYDLKSSYDYNPSLFSALISDNITAIDDLGHGSLPFSKDLTLLLHFIGKYESYEAFRDKIIEITNFFSSTEKPYQDLPIHLALQQINKDSLINLIFSMPTVIKTDGVIEDLQSVIDSIQPGDRLEPIKTLYTDQLEAKESTTSTDVIVATLDILVSEAQGLCDDLISDIVLADSDLVTRIDTGIGYTDSFPHLIQADRSMTSPEEIKEFTEECYKVSYVINNAAQNLTLDDRALGDSLVIGNLEFTKTINSMVSILNQNELYIMLMMNYLDIQYEATVLSNLTSTLAGHNSTLDSEITSINGGGPIKEEFLISLGKEIDYINSEINSSCKRLDSYGQDNSKIGNSQNDLSLFSYKTSTRFSTELTGKQGAMESLALISSGQLLAQATTMAGTYSELESASIKVAALAVAVSLANDPNATVRSFFNLLAAPIEAVLLVTNAAICTLKAAQCLLCIVKAGVGKSIDKLTELTQKALDLINGDSNLSNFLTDLKNDIVDAFGSILEGSVCSDIQNQKQLDQAAIRSALAGTGLSDNFPGYDLTAKQKIFNDVVSGSCSTFFGGLASATMNVISTEFGNMVDEIKASVENTIDNLYSLSSCGGCSNLGLKIDLPDLPSINLSFPDFVLNIPYLDSKVIKC